jgi:hypothetical protein
LNSILPVKSLNAHFFFQFFHFVHVSILNVFLFVFIVLPFFPTFQACRVFVVVPSNLLVCLTLHVSWASHLELEGLRVWRRVCGFKNLLFFSNCISDVGLFECLIGPIFIFNSSFTQVRGGSMCVQQKKSFEKSKTFLHQLFFAFFYFFFYSFLFMVLSYVVYDNKAGKWKESQLLLSGKRNIWWDEINIYNIYTKHKNQKYI